MNTKFGCKDWEQYIPIPVNDERPEYLVFYKKAWDLAFEHIKNVPGMPQSPYMDEAFCETQIWIWDTCFMSLFCKYARMVFPGVESLDNFYKVLYEGKRLPKVIPTKDEPEWVGAMPGKPYEIKIHIADNPPLFAWAEYENACFGGDKEYIKELLYKRGVLQKHYTWMESLHEFTENDKVFAPTCLISEKYGYKWEGGRSGMDNTPRGRVGKHAEASRPNNPDMLWIDAICQQALAARMIAKLYAVVGDKANEVEWSRKHRKKKQIINDLYWDKKDGFYYDIDCNTHGFYRVKSMASYWTLVSETATKERAEKLVDYIKDPNTFGGFVPFVSLARNDNDYVANGKYWRGGVWLPTAYMALKGFILYGYYEEARAAAKKLLEHMYRTYVDYVPHTIWECYHPGKYEPSVDPYEGGNIVNRDFCGWSALGPISVYIEFILGFYEIDAFNRKIKWAKPKEQQGRIGIKNLRFGDIVTDIVAEENVCHIYTNKEYEIEIDKKSYQIAAGENTIFIA